MAGAADAMEPRAMEAPLGMRTSASLSALPRYGNVREAFSAPIRWTRPPVSHHPRQPAVPDPLLSGWKDSAAEGRAAHGVSAKHRKLLRTEALLNERLASAAATLQTYKMRAIAAAEGVQHVIPHPLMAMPGSYPPSSVLAHQHHNPYQPETPATPAEPGLGLVGSGVPSSNERLVHILSDLMQ